jgi:guanylate kinase
VSGRRGTLFILSAPSGAGKDTLLEALRPERFGIERIVSYTTRPRRDYEVDGVHYHFVDVPTLRRMDTAGELIECSEYIPGRFYATPRRAVEEALAAGRDVLIKPEVQGAAKVKAQFPGAVLIFLAPPSAEEAERRMQGRGSETSADAAERVAAMRRELAAAGRYDHVVVNETGRLEEAVQRVAAIIAQERARRAAAQ